MSVHRSSQQNQVLTRGITTCANPSVIPLALKPLTSSMISAGLLLHASPGFAQDNVSSTLPANASHNSSVDATVQATLSNSETSGLSATTFVVHHSQAHRANSNTVAGAGTSVVSVNPFADFHPGERVSASVTAGVMTANGAVTPHVWRFRAAPSAGTGLFFQSDNSLGNGTSWGGTLGDLDGDGDLDAFEATIYGADKIWLNDGTGSFTQNIDLPVVTASTSVSLGDIDGDGDLDAVTGTNYGSGVKVWRNNGSASLSLIGTLALNNSATIFGIELGDLDGDGDLDIFATTFGQTPDRVWKNTGSGAFASTSNSLGNTQSADVALGDVDGDGDLDAFVANFYFQPSRVWINNGDGLFSQSNNSIAATTSFSVDLGDLDGDGDLDAFVSTINNRADSVFLNNGSGLFSSAGMSLGVTDGRSIALADIDNDSDLDAYVAIRNQKDRVLVNDGQGNFLLSSNDIAVSHSHAVAMGDVDDDGDIDAFVFNSNQANRVWLNGDLDFGDAPAPLATLLSDNGPRHVIDPDGPRLGASVDSETDGQPTAAADGDDLATSDDEDGVAISSALLPGHASASVTIDVQQNSGLLDMWVDFDNDGSFAGADERVTSGLAVGIGTHSVRVVVPAHASVEQHILRARLSSSGVPGPNGRANDGEVEDHSITISAPDGLGQFVATGNSLGVGNTNEVALGDIDGDGDFDAVVANPSDNAVWLNDGSGAFTRSSQQFTDLNGNDVDLGDIDGDGDLDALFLGSNTNFAHQLWFNDGTGTFTLGSQTLTNTGARAAAFGDLDNDGDIDIVLSNWPNGAHRVWFNDGTGTFTQSSNSLSTPGSTDVELADLDNDGDLDLAFSNQIWKNDGAGQFTPTSNVFGFNNQIVLGDIDDDGDIDLLELSISRQNRTWVNDGSGVFVQGSVSPITENSIDGALADIDGDGDLDAVIANFSSQANSVWLNDGSGEFSETPSFGSSNARDIALGDLNGDGSVDAFVGNAGQPNRVWLNLTNTLDSDGDGLTDVLEISLGLDPNNPDSDGDGVADGDEDTDGDGFGNSTEVEAGADPNDVSSRPAGDIASIPGSACRANNKQSQQSLSYGSGRVINNHPVKNRFVVCTPPRDAQITSETHALLSVSLPAGSSASCTLRRVNAANGFSLNDSRSIDNNTASAMDAALVMKVGDTTGAARFSSITCTLPPGGALYAIHLLQLP